MIFKSILGGVLFSLVLASTSHLVLADNRDELERNQEKCVENFNNIGVKFYSHMICKNIRMQEFSNNPLYMNCVVSNIELEDKGAAKAVLSCREQEIRDRFNDEEYLGCVRFFRNNKLTDADSISACKEKAVIEAAQDSRFLSCISAQRGSGEMKSVSIIRCTDPETRLRVDLKNTQYLNCHKAMKKIGLNINDRFAFCNKGNFEATSDPRFYNCVKSAMGDAPQRIILNRTADLINMHNAGALTAVENCADLKEREKWEMSVMPELDDTDFVALADGLNLSTSTFVPTQNAEAIRERSIEESAQAIKQVVDGVKQFLTPAQSVKQAGKSVRVK